MQYPSNRNFLILMAMITIIVNGVSLINGNGFNFLLISLFIALVIFAFVFPSYFAFIKEKFIDIGSIIGKVVSPILLFSIFLVIITPIALTMKISRRDYLKLNFDRSMDSYWQKKKHLSEGHNKFTMQF